MAYPSIISQPDRNYSPISEALRPWINESIASSSSLSSSKRASSDHSEPKIGTARAKILEIGSYPYAHIRRFASDFGEVEWYGSGRDEWEVNEIKAQEHSLQNLHDPFHLDIAQDEDWTGIRTQLSSSPAHDGEFSGVVMLNVIHCCPEGTPEHVFRQLTHSETGTRILQKGGWIAVYGPYLADDGSYKSQGDEESYIKAKDTSLGLRTVRSITEYARKWGFEEVERKEMPKGNMWVVWKLVR